MQKALLSFIPQVYFTKADLRAILISENRVHARKGKRDMFNVQFALSFKEHQEQLLSSIDYCLDSISVRSYKAKQNDYMIS